MSNKTSDKNVAIIEELIKEYRTYNDLDGIQDLSIYINALENILAELEQMLKEREKYTIRLTDEEYRKVIENTQMDISNDRVIAHKFAVMQQQIIEKDKRIQELEEYIAIAPNLDEMTATKYIAIQEEAYIRGKAEEQQKAEQIIRENYIPKQAVIDKMEELNKEIKSCDEIDAIFKIKQQQVLQELLEGEK